MANCNLANSVHEARKQFGRSAAGAQSTGSEEQAKLPQQLASLVRTLYPATVLLPDTHPGDEEGQLEAPPACLVELRLVVLQQDWAYFFFHHEEHTLSSVTRFSPAFLSGNNFKLLFLVFQLVRIFQVFAKRNLYPGDVNLKDFAVTETLQVQLRPDFSQLLPLSGEKLAAAACSGSAVAAPVVTAAASFCDVVQAWVAGSLSNLDYLLYLNRLTGRRYGDPNFHPVLPWVSDFSSESASSLRDLTKSKFRLNKGDEALDRTYERYGNTALVPYREMSEFRLWTKIHHPFSKFLKNLVYLAV